MSRKQPKQSIAVLRGGRTLWGSMAKHWDAYVFILPALAYLIIFSYVPMYGIQLAFKNFSPGKGIWGSPWVGLENFMRYFNSYYFERTMRNTFLLSLYSMIAGMPFPILLAIMLNEVRFSKYKKIVQTVTYAPNFISTVVMVGMLVIFLNPNYGIFGKLYSLLGIDKIDLINTASTFPHVYVWSGIWQSTGFGSIIYLAVLSAVDPQLHEAAIVEGANKLQRIWHINMPVLMPTVIIMFIMNAGNIMSVGFEKVFLMQNPLNLETSEVLTTYVYKVGLQKGSDFGLSTAVGLLSSVINAALLFIVNTVSGAVSDTSLW